MTNLSELEQKRLIIDNLKDIGYYDIFLRVHNLDENQTQKLFNSLLRNNIIKISSEVKNDIKN